MRAIIGLLIQELVFKVLPRTRLRRPRSSPRRSRMAAWPRGRSSAHSSRSSASRCCLGPGYEDPEARRGDRGWPPGQEGDHRPGLPGARLQGAASDQAAKTSKLAAEIAVGRLAKRAIIGLFSQELGFKVLPRNRLRRPRSSPRRSRMAAWPRGRSSSRSLPSRC
jgi:hypothetical protein